MGYYTNYTLETPSGFPVTQEQRDLAEGLEGKGLKVKIESLISHVKIDNHGSIDICNYRFYGNWDEDAREYTCNEAKFYNHDEVFRKISSEYPGLFILRGDGEEDDDLWIKYFQDGKSYKVEPTVIWPEFDSSKLK